MEPNIQQKLGEIEAKLNDIYISTEKTRRYFQITLWVTVIMFVLPLLGLLFAIPVFVNSYLNTLNGLI